MHPAAGHALVRRLDHHRHPLGLEHGADGAGDLGRHPLLELQPPGIGLDQARQLADADHPLVGKIGDMGLADDRRQMMLAVGLEADVAQHHHLVIAVGLLEGAREDQHRVVPIAREVLLIGPHHPLGRADQPFPVRIVPGPEDQGPDRLFR